MKVGYELYPQRQSPLELQLDLFFDLERTEAAKEELRKDFHFFELTAPEELIENTTPRISAARRHSHEIWLKQEVELHEELRSNVASIPRAPLRTLPDTYFRPTWKFRNGELWPHQSWFGELASAWLRTPVEIYEPPAPSLEQVIIDLHVFGDARPCGDNRVSLPVSSGRNRNRDLKFSLEFAPLEADETEDKKQYRTFMLSRFNSTASYVWSGLRRTPASGDLIDRCLNNLFACAKLLLTKGHRWSDSYGEQQVDYSKVEYCPLGGHSSNRKITVYRSGARGSFRFCGLN